MLATVLGYKNVIKLFLKNASADVNVKEINTEVNAFWLAAFYGNGPCLKILSEAGAFVYCRHKETQSNALHVAISNKHYNVAT